MNIYSIMVRGYMSPIWVGGSEPGMLKVKIKGLEIKGLEIKRVKSSFHQRCINEV